MEPNLYLQNILLKLESFLKITENYILNSFRGDKKEIMTIFDFDEEKVTPYFEPVKELIKLIEVLLSVE